VSFVRHLTAVRFVRHLTAVRFVRHLTAVALLVAVVVAGGLAWGHFAGPLPPGPGPGGAGNFVVRGQAVKRLPPGVKIRPGLRIVSIGPENLGLTSMFQAVNLPVLRDTVEIEAGAIAAVVILETGHRKIRRARRARRLAARP
jgi:hypothetical protein